MSHNNMNHNRIQQTFSQAEKSVFITFITAGDVKTANPISDTVKIMHGLVKGGADIIELGVPFSDPSADGPTIQQANERTLAHNVSIKDVITMVSEFRLTNTGTPVVLMGYVNPIENLGYENFVNSASKAGVDGLITVDLSPEESTDFNKLLSANNICPIYILAPTSTESRIKLIASQASGFIYYVAVKGVTGSKKLDLASVKVQIANIKKITNLPIAVGFGIDNPDTVQQISEFADAVVVGSAIIKHLYKTYGEATLVAQNFVASLLPKTTN